MIYKSTLEISKEDWERMNALQEIEDIQDEENEDLIEELDAREDDESYGFVFEFENGNTITIQQYSGSTNYWISMWLNDDYDNDEVVDLDESMVYIDENDDEYICEFIIK